MRRVAVRGCIPGLVILLLGLGAPPARAWLEQVLVVRAGEYDAVIERATGERFRLDLHEDCLALRGHGGSSVLLWSPEPGISSRSLLLVPEWDLSCPVWQVDTLERARSASRVPAVPTEGLRAMRQALELLGLDCGPPGRDWTPDVAQAFLRFREGKHLDATGQGLRRTVTSLALDVMRGRQATGTSQRLARVISDQLDPLVGYLMGAGGGGATCSTPTWVRAVAEQGALVTLADGTRWQPAATARPWVARWQNDDDLLVCSARLVNARTGEMAPATRLE